jgi:hypothetical protein
MTFRIATPSTRVTASLNVSAALIGDWAERVMDLWEATREPALAETQPTQELEDACLVRDQLQNRLDVTYPESTACPPRSLQVLRSADSLFRQITTESASAADLCAHNHYPLRSEWWWGRLPRLRTNLAKEFPGQRRR